MRTIKIKVVGEGEPAPQHPLASPGWVGNVRTYAVTDCPDDVSLAEVIRIFGQTVNATWLFDDKAKPDAQRGRYTFAWPELGPGVIIRR